MLTRNAVRVKGKCHLRKRLVRARAHCGVFETRTAANAVYNISRGEHACYSRYRYDVTPPFPGLISAGGTGETIGASSSSRKRTRAQIMHAREHTRVHA
jgi:hypothetical protein